MIDRQVNTYACPDIGGAGGNDQLVFSGIRPETTGLDIEVSQIDRRYAIPSTQYRGNVIILDETKVDEYRTKTAAVMALVDESRIELLRGDQVCLYEVFTYR